MPKESLQQARKHEFNLCSGDFWYFMQFIETEDEDRAIFRPFPQDYDYLHRLNDAIINNQKVILLKSRRLLASWLMVMRHYWQAKFAGTKAPGSKDVFRGALMSIGQTEAQYLIQRISRSDKRLPDWLRMRNPLMVDNLMYLEFELGGTIQAFPLKREGPQTFGFTEVGFDEMALQEAVRTVWTGLIPTLGDRGKLVAVSTPNGKQNLFYDIWSNKDDAYKDIYRIKLHWTDNPEHDDEWFKKTTSGMDKQMVARMFELSFAAYYGTPVWSTWNDRMHKAEETEVYPDRPMFVGWDLGYNRPACIFAQRNSRDQWVGHREVVDTQISFDKFCEKVIINANAFYDRNVVPEIHCVPPDARHRYRNRSVSGATNDAAEIKQVFGKGNNPAKLIFAPTEVGTRAVEGPRLKETRKVFAMRSDGEPGAYFNEKMITFIEGCQGGYAYPEKGDSEVPDKNEYSDPQDAFQHIVTAYNRMVKPQNQYKKKEYTRQKRKPGRWKIGIPQRQR